MTAEARRQPVDSPDPAPLAEALARLLVGVWLAKQAEGGEPTTTDDRTAAVSQPVTEWRQ
jgi:hypothetical protein